MASGIASIRSAHSVDKTVSRIEGLLNERGVKIFALVDHSGEARMSGLEMPPTKLLIFGNPKAGTPIMLAAPSAALDLPMKILVAEDPDGRVAVSWNDPLWLQERHGFAAELSQNLAAAEMIAKQAAE
jgi:uncharacterized protein (DUF302 family)